MGLLTHAYVLHRRPTRDSPGRLLRYDLEMLARCSHRYLNTSSNTRAKTNYPTRIGDSQSPQGRVNRTFPRLFRKRSAREAVLSQQKGTTTTTMMISSPAEPHQALGPSLAGPGIEDEAWCYPTVRVIGAVLNSTDTTRVPNWFLRRILLA